jgi:hypothetical protein
MKRAVIPEDMPKKKHYLGYLAALDVEKIVCLWPMC